VFETVFFATFLALYYAVLLERHPERLGFFEVLLYIWIAAFAYDEIGEFRDAGHLFYAADFWSLWDLCIILVGIAFLIARTSSAPIGSQSVTQMAWADWQRQGARQVITE
jgi:hypothetical protein